MDTCRIFLLSPPFFGGKRGGLIFNNRAQFALAQRIRSREGAPLGDVCSFISGLYFRGKLIYARAFAQPPTGCPGLLVITPGQGLKPADEIVTIDTLRKYASVIIDRDNIHYRQPLEQDATKLDAVMGAQCEIVLLGSVATGKYIDVLSGVFGPRLKFPAEFVGRGDMSRGGLMLRCAREGRELSYISVEGAVRHGPRPEKLPKLKV